MVKLVRRTDCPEKVRWSLAAERMVGPFTKITSARGSLGGVALKVDCGMS